MTRPRFISPNEVSALRTNILSKLTYAVGIPTMPSTMTGSRPLPWPPATTSLTAG